MGRRNRKLLLNQRQRRWESQFLRRNRKLLLNLLQLRQGQRRWESQFLRKNRKLLLNLLQAWQRQRRWESLCLKRWLRPPLSTTVKLVTSSHCLLRGSRVPDRAGTTVATTLLPLLLAENAGPPMLAERIELAVGSWWSENAEV